MLIVPSDFVLQPWMSCFQLRDSVGPYESCDYCFEMELLRKSVKEICSKKLNLEAASGTAENLPRRGELASILRTGLWATPNTAMSAITQFGRRYARVFKEKAVPLVLGGRRQGEVSRDLGVSSWFLGEWVKNARAGPSPTQSEMAKGRSRCQDLNQSLFSNPGFTTSASAVSSSESAVTITRFKKNVLLPLRAAGDGQAVSRIAKDAQRTTPNSARRFLAQAFSFDPASAGISAPKLTVWRRRPSAPA